MLKNPSFYFSSSNCFLCKKESKKIYELNTGKFSYSQICEDCLGSKKCKKCKKDLEKENYHYLHKNSEITCYDCIKKQRKKKGDILRNNYEKHRNFQKELKKFFESLGFKVKLERQLTYYKVVDLILWNEKMNIIHGIELKTGKLNKKLSWQLEKYGYYFDYFYLMINDKEASKLDKGNNDIYKIDKKYGIFVILKEKIKPKYKKNFILFRKPKKNEFTKERLLNLFKEYLLRHICYDYGLACGPTWKLRKAILEKMDYDELKKIYCRFIMGYYSGFSYITNKEFYRKWPHLKPKEKKFKKLSDFI